MINKPEKIRDAEIHLRDNTFLEQFDKFWSDLPELKWRKSDKDVLEYYLTWLVERGMSSAEAKTMFLDVMWSFFLSLNDDRRIAKNL